MRLATDVGQTHCAYFFCFDVFSSSLFPMLTIVILFNL